MLTRLAKDKSIGEVTVMAHSMGTWLAVEALRQMAIRNGRVDPKISNVILAAPDLDVDVFSRQFASFGKAPPKFTLFVSQDDRALSLSRRISGNVDRLGQIDPSVEPYRSQLEKAGITVLDLTKLQSGDRLNHGKFAESPEVVRLIGDRLIASQTVTDSDVGLGRRWARSASVPRKLSERRQASWSARPLRFSIRARVKITAGRWRGSAALSKTPSDRLVIRPAPWWTIRRFSLRE